MGTDDVRMLGRVGLGATALLLVGNVVHPFDGTTEMYGDALLFMEKTGAVWVVDHVVLALTFLVVPAVTWAWARTLATERARVLGHVATLVVLMGCTVGVLHLGGVDGLAMAAYADLVEADPGDATLAAGAAVLLKVHLATFTAWLITLWIGGQAALGLAALADGRRPWVGWLLLVAAGLALASLVATALAGQLTTLSEPILFRPSTFGFTIWLLLASLDMSRATSPSAAAGVGRLDAAEA